MALNVAIGGARDTFADRFGSEVARALDRAFGSEGEWEGMAGRRFGELAPEVLADLARRAVDELGTYAVGNLATIAAGNGIGVFLPAHVEAVSFPLSDGRPLRCASLPGLREELAALADRWDLPVDEPGLLELLRVYDDPVDGPVSERLEDITFARLALAANEAARRDCPLWLLLG